MLINKAQRWGRFWAKFYLWSFGNKLEWGLEARLLIVVPAWVIARHVTPWHSHVTPSTVTWQCALSHDTVHSHVTPCIVTWQYESRDNMSPVTPSIVMWHHSTVTWHRLQSRDTVEKSRDTVHSHETPSTVTWSTVVSVLETHSLIIKQMQMHKFKK